MADRWLSVNELSEHLGIAPDTIYRWLERRHMPGHRVGRLWKFKVGEVDEWVRSGSAAEDAPADPGGRRTARRRAAPARVGGRRG